MTTENASFTFEVDDIFEFAEGRTVLVGRVIGEAPGLLAPSTVDVLINDTLRGPIVLDAERLPTAKDGRRSVETKAKLATADMRSGRCILRRR